MMFPLLLAINDPRPDDLRRVSSGDHVSS